MSKKWITKGDYDSILQERENRYLNFFSVLLITAFALSTSLYFEAINQQKISTHSYTYLMNQTKNFNFENNRADKLQVEYELNKLDNEWRVWETIRKTSLLWTFILIATYFLFAIYKSGNEIRYTIETDLTKTEVKKLARELTIKFRDLRVGVNP